MKNAQNQTESNTKLRRSQLQALPILATSPNYTQAARTLGVSTERIYAWLKDAEFKRELDKLRNEIVEDSVAKMKGYTSKAVDTLGSLLDESNPSIRRGVANDLLNQVTRFIELQELEKRISTLEEK